MNTAAKFVTVLRKSGDGSASFLARPTGAATLTISALTVSASTTVDWGDGSTNTYTGSGTRTHNYASAGTYQVRILQPENVTVFNLTNTAGMPVTLNSANLKSLVNVADFRAQQLPATSAGTFNSADVSEWRPSTFIIQSMPTGYTGTFNSADVSEWRPSTFQLHTMPTGYTGTFNSADVSEWRPSNFVLQVMPTGYTGTFNSADVSEWRPSIFFLNSMPMGYTVTITAGGFSAWTGVSSFQMLGNSLSSAAIDQILADLYTAAQSRTASGGTINLSGTNAAPGGTYAAACPPTTGKEYAYELINDSCGVIAAGETWTTITVTGGLP